MSNKDIYPRRVQVVRYLSPLREGGSMPAIVEADDGFLYVLKFRGAGQGVKALIAEFIGGEIARTLGFRVPEIVLADLSDEFGRTEPDEEIQDLLQFSVGLNLGLHYLSGSITFDPVVDTVDAKTASKMVWMDSLLMNVDRTARNTNLLIWNKELWLIDHGASLYFHHSWDDWQAQAKKPFEQIKNHVLLSQATQLEAVDREAKELLSKEKLTEIVSLIPEEWLLEDDTFSNAKAFREAYVDFLMLRLANSELFINAIKQIRG